MVGEGLRLSWDRPESLTHLGSRAHLLVQAVPMERIWGPREHCGQSQSDRAEWLAPRDAELQPIPARAAPIGP